MMRRLVLPIVIALGAALASCGTAADDRFAAYLRAVAGDEADRGWSYLDETTREWSYANDLDAYMRDASVADWSAFKWAPPTRGWTDDGFSHVTAELLSAPESVPRFLIMRRLVHGVCRDGEAVGIGAYVDSRPFAGDVLGGGGETGGQRICNNLFGEATPEG